MRKNKLWLILLACSYTSITGLLGSGDSGPVSSPTNAVEEKSIDEENSQLQLLECAQKGDLNGLKSALKKGADLYYCIEDKMCKSMDHPLLVAIVKGHLNIVQFLLQQDPRLIEIFNEEGCNLLIVAVKSGCMEVVQYLCETNPDLIQPENEDRSPLFHSIISGHTDIMEYLFNKIHDLSPNGLINSIFFENIQNITSDIIDARHDMLDEGTSVLEDELKMLIYLLELLDLHNEYDIKLSLLEIMVDKAIRSRNETFTFSIKGNEGDQKTTLNSTIKAFANKKSLDEALCKKRFCEKPNDFNVSMLNCITSCYRSTNRGMPIGLLYILNKLKTDANDSEHLQFIKGIWITHIAPMVETPQNVIDLDLLVTIHQQLAQTPSIDKNSDMIVKYNRVHHKLEEYIRSINCFIEILESILNFVDHVGFQDLLDTLHEGRIILTGSFAKAKSARADGSYLGKRSRSLEEEDSTPEPKQQCLGIATPTETDIKNAEVKNEEPEEDIDQYLFEAAKKGASPQNKDNKVAEDDDDEGIPSIFSSQQNLNTPIHHSDDNDSNDDTPSISSQLLGSEGMTHTLSLLTTAAIMRMNESSRK